MNLSDKQIHLLQAADDVISIKGYDTTTLRDIANNAGVNIALISYYFGSKEKMMRELLHYKCYMLRTHIAQFFSTIQNGLPTMQLRELIRQSIRHLFRILHLKNEVEKEFSIHISLHTSLVPFLELLTIYIDEVLKRGIAQGIFTFFQKAEDLTTMIVGAVFFAFDNKDFYQNYLIPTRGEDYFTEAEKNITISISFSVFASLGTKDARH